MDRARAADGRSRGSIQAAAGWGRAERKRHLNRCPLLALRYQCGHARTATRWTRSGLCDFGGVADGGDPSFATRFFGSTLGELGITAGTQPVGRAPGSPPGPNRVAKFRPPPRTPRPKSQSPDLVHRATAWRKRAQTGLDSTTLRARKPTYSKSATATSSPSKMPTGVESSKENTDSTGLSGP